jgi:type VI secretion system protein ImpJ
MNQRPVHWSEGMFLRPQHFQAAQRATGEALTRLAQFQQPHYHGLARCRIDLDALAGFRFILRELDACFRDGLLVSLPADAPLPELDLKSAFLGRTQLEVYLAIPKWRAGQSNVGTQVTHRFRAEPQPTEDENTGTNAQTVSYRIPNLRLLTTDDDRSGFEVLLLARLEKSDRAEATPKLATGFIPALLRCEAWPGLQVDLVQQVYFRLGKKIEVLASQVVSRGISFDSQSSGDARRMHQLAQMNETYSVLSQVAFVPGVHPWQAFTELTRLVGQLAIFSKDARPPELPRYDHDDLGTGFWKLKQYIDALLNDIEDPAYEERPFIGSGLRLQVALESAWLESGWSLFLGVRSNISSEDCIKMLTRPERLGMKIGSSDRVDAIFTKGQEGLRFTPAPRAPRDLPSAPNLTYFEVSRESSSNEWAHVQKAKTLAIRIQERDIVGAMDGQKELTIRTGGQAITFTFTLYLVPLVK